MSLLVLGLNHRTAALDLRERLTIEKEQLAPSLDLLSRYVEHGVIVSTCNRLEIVLDEDADTTEVRALLSDVPIHEVSGEDATVYLLRVATGLESMVRGEDQILGQLREAFKLAESHCLLSPSLRILRTRRIEA
ncbi:MAG: glutamyl-tRNA reductase, partial [Chloroflexi bacterium]|nr:glutamyl-tRNA reductase [Chloroflexota bacterium]